MLRLLRQSSPGLVHRPLSVLPFRPTPLTPLRQFSLALHRSTPIKSNFRTPSSILLYQSQLFNRDSFIRYNSTKRDSDEQQQQPQPQHPSTSGNLKRQEFLAKFKPNKNFLTVWKLRLKWMLLRSNRPFNIDELTAFVSWILMGNFIWILIGTTTFVGLIVYIVNLISNSSFGDVINNKWILEKLITLDNKLIIEPSNTMDFKAEFKDGAIEFSNLIVKSPNTTDGGIKYEFIIDKIRFTLSLSKWLDGKGLIKDVSLTGVNGNVDLHKFSKNSKSFICTLDDSFPENYTFEKIEIHDLKAKITQFTDIETLQVIEFNIFTCNLDKLRSNWVTYDFLNATSLSGSLNGSLFTLHKLQKNQLAHFSALDEYPSNDSSSSSILPTVLTRHSYDDDEPYKKITRLRIDQLDISYLHNLKYSKLNWIQSGKVELVIDIMLPNEDKEDSVLTTSETIWNSLKFKINDIINDSMTTIMKTDTTTTETTKSPTLSPTPIAPATATATATTNNDTTQNKYLVMDIKLIFNELKATLPSNPPHSSLTSIPYISQIDLKSLVTFINDKKYGLSKILNNSSNYSNHQLNQDDENPFDGSQLPNNSLNNPTNSLVNDGSLALYSDSSIPPIKFRLVYNLNDFEYLDLVSLLSFSDLSLPSTTTTESIDPKLMKMFKNTSKFIDLTVFEILSYLMLYKEEISIRLIELYSKRSNFEIFFNNLILGNLILVGLGTFVI
ncbi:hypothetical protein CANARDRAFT_29822 [[Candida] arabinofermentans NRRL YB-2248]|uniref:Mitochondrial distribution and morphology protein 32 n=1 Tax=[Candida] arabinofermentans NRRL YB-2248 TaxID=983967 RepID=A0A1E4SVQ8_9ASCO|nr:hypothetical protein CANARDRAFT_29822 [[Candida] arabinofermentans NRRL YB-2248]